MIRGEFMRKKKVLVYGYKKLNLGDDLFFSILFKRYRDIKFIFPGAKEYKKVFKEYKNVKVIYPYSIVDLFLTLWDKIFNRNKTPLLERLVDFKVLITGSGFAENTLGKFERSSDKKLFVISSNFGPYYTQEFLSEAKLYFKNCSDVCFRDNQSYNFFSELSNTRVAPDVVFDVQTYFSNLRDSEFIKSINFDTQRYAVVSLISFKKRSKNQCLEKNYLEGIKRISEHLISKELKIVFLSFCQAEGDCNAVNEIIKDEYIQKNSCHYIYNGNIKETLSIIKNSDSVIATRFHAMVLGLAMSKRTLPIVYDSKMTNVLNDLKIKNSFDTNSIASIAVEELEEWYNNTPAFDSVKTANEAKNQFKGLDSALEYHKP